MPSSNSPAVRRPRRPLAALFLFAALALSFVTAREARADSLSSCGDIFLDAAATCTLKTSGGCTAECTPVNFDLACSAQLEVSCSGGCNLDVDAMCDASCEGTCMGNCMADPGSLDCNADCSGRCEGDCTTECASDSNQSECMTSCQASCNGRCSASCTGTDPSASCEAKCSASCSGSCTASANLDCDVKCQEKGYASCEASLTGGCNLQCSAPMGALFCNGKYVDAVGDDLESCVDQLAADLNIHATASGDASCSGDSCEAEGKVSVSGCSTNGRDGNGGDASLLAGMAVVGLVVARRRRRANG